MHTDELRDIIWDHLFRAKAAKSFQEIASFANCDVAAVGTAVNHEWFTVAGDRASIAFTVPSGNGNP